MNSQPAMLPWLRAGDEADGFGAPRWTSKRMAKAAGAIPIAAETEKAKATMTAVTRRTQIVESTSSGWRFRLGGSFEGFAGAGTSKGMMLVSGTIWDATRHYGHSEPVVYRSGVEHLRRKLTSRPWPVARSASRSRALMLRRPVRIQPRARSKLGPCRVTPRRSSPTGQFVLGYGHIEPRSPARLGDTELPGEVNQPVTATRRPSPTRRTPLVGDPTLAAAHTRTPARPECPELAARKSRNSMAEMTRASMGSIAVALAERGRPSIEDSSPTRSPGPHTPSTTSRPCSRAGCDLDPPVGQQEHKVRMSPSWNKVDPPRNRRIVPRACRMDCSVAGSSVNHRPSSPTSSDLAVMHHSSVSPNCQRRNITSGHLVVHR